MEFLPPPSPNSNPFDFALHLIGEDNHPTRGYSARLVVLGCFVIAVPIGSAALFFLHWLALRRRREKLWLFKLVKRDAGRSVMSCYSLHQ